MRLNESTAQRIVRKHGGRFRAGEWDFATVESKIAADALIEELRYFKFQVLRSPVDLGKGGWEVMFR